MKTGSPRAVAVAMKLTGSPKVVGRTLRNIARKMGLKTIKDLNPNRVESDNATGTQLKEQLALQQYRCALSGMKLTKEEAELDHIVPVSEGGTNDINNLQWLHYSVNRMKGTMSQDEFLLICRRVTEWNH